MQDNPLAQLDYSTMRDGEIRIQPIMNGNFFGVKKMKWTQNGKILEYKTAVGSSREEVVKELNA